ncbi:MAG: hypothetical protein FGM58_08285, partial [Acidimicrobiia bacterium]|nr:hypothetical protein [Acidimicrobiia bacterium]
MTKPIVARTRPRRRARIIAPVRRRIGLRWRLTLTFALGALLLSVSLAFITYALTRQNLLDQRDETAVSRTIDNADRLAIELPADLTPAMVERDLNSLPHPNAANSLLWFKGQWYSTNPLAFASSDLPPSIVSLVDSGQSARMRTRIDGSVQLVIGVPLSDLGATYYESVPLADLQDTLDGLAFALFAAAAATTVAGALLGYWASRRVFAPLLDVGTAAESIAGGLLDTRLPEGA